MLFDCCFGDRFHFGSQNSVMGRNKPIEFNSKLRKQFHNLVECPITITKRITLLESMESLFECPKFQYEDEDSTILGMRYLLATWEVILSGLNSVVLCLGSHS